LTTLTYDDDETLGHARARYWEANGFGDDGGYSKTWEIVKLGPVPIPIRNIEARKEAIRFHDLHHVVTGYDTDFTGEAEISAWELAAGCSDKWVAWLLGF
jgi:ubiquinone biosynthesis protein Coq4